jgi:uncharacterized protein (DUF1330 family)
LDGLARTGAIAMVDLVRCPSHEARIAFPSVMQSVLQRSGGSVAWSGSIDQQLIGRGSDRFEDVLISEFPNREACVLALAERASWQPEAFVTEIRTFVAAPWSGAARWLMRPFFAWLRLRGGGPEPWRPDSDPSPTPPEPGIASPEIGPDAEQLEALMADDLDRRVVMLNFLQFRERASYADPEVERSGAAAYLQYGRNTIGLIGRMGGRVLWQGQRAKLLSEGPQQDWSSIALVEYPSRRAFLGMLRSEAYQSGSHHRDAGLERSDLLACTSHALFF